MTQTSRSILPILQTPWTLSKPPFVESITPNLQLVGAWINFACSGGAFGIVTNHCRVSFLQIILEHELTDSSSDRRISLPPLFQAFPTHALRFQVDAGHFALVPSGLTATRIFWKSLV